MFRIRGVGFQNEGVRGNAVEILGGQGVERNALHQVWTPRLTGYIFIESLYQ